MVRPHEHGARHRSAGAVPGSCGRCGLRASHISGLKVRGRSRAGGCILCRTAHDVIPREVAGRPAVGSADAAYLGARLARFAETNIGDAAFQREREISNGIFLRSKEEFLYFRLFREVFPVAKVLPLVERGLAAPFFEAPCKWLSSPEC